MITVHVREPCSECLKGIVRNPEYVKWCEAFDHRYGGIVMVDDDEWRAYVRENPIPPDQAPCPNCEGNGYFDRWVSMHDFMAMAELEQ